MSDLEDKLGAILSNPQIMQQIASMAQAMGQSAGEQQQAQPKAAPPSAIPDPAKRCRNAPEKQCGPGSTGIAPCPVPFFKPGAYQQAGKGHACSQNG